MNGQSALKKLRILFREASAAATIGFMIATPLVSFNPQGNIEFADRLTQEFTQQVYSSSALIKSLNNTFTIKRDDKDIARYIDLITCRADERRRRIGEATPMPKELSGSHLRFVFSDPANRPAYYAEMVYRAGAFERALELS